MACHAEKCAQSLTFQRLSGNLGLDCIDSLAAMDEHTHCLRTDHSHALTADCCRMFFKVETRTELVDYIFLFLFFFSLAERTLKDLLLFLYFIPFGDAKWHR